MDVTETLRQAVADPPPTGVDIDVIIGRERRRQRRLTATVGAGLVALVLVGTPLIVVDRSRDRGGEPAGSPPARPCPRVSEPPPDPHPTGPPTPGPSPAQRVPTEECAVAAARLDAVLTGQLTAVLPGAHVTNAVDPAKPPVWFELDRDGYYLAAVEIRTATARGKVTVQVDPTREDPGTEPFCGPTGCTYEQRPDGTRIFTDAEPDNPVEVHVFLADHTHIWLDEGHVGDRAADRPVTVDQLVAIGADQRLTLYP